MSLSGKSTGKRTDTSVLCNESLSRAPETDMTLQIGRRTVAAPWGGVGGTSGSSKPKEGARQTEGSRACRVLAGS